MPYANILWVKLEIRLLNDPRFFTLPESAQLLYVKLLCLAGDLKNRIPKAPEILRQLTRSASPDQEITYNLGLIKDAFPKFLETKDFYCFKDWASRHNWVANKETNGNSQGTPKEILRYSILSSILNVYIRKKEYSGNSLGTPFYKRFGRAARTLYFDCAQKDEALCIEAINYTAKILDESGCDWTLETVIKRWPDFIKQREKPESEYDRALKKLRQTDGKAENNK
jgi:hypothetical protein